MTPVVLLSDNYIANGSEPWKLPKLEDLPRFEVKFETKDPGPEGFLPYQRGELGARPWAVPGTPGLQHRIGGLEKEHLTGNVSYDADNHQLMTRLRHEKVQNVRETIPTPWSRKIRSIRRSLGPSLPGSSVSSEYFSQSPASFIFLKKPASWPG